MAVPVAKLAIIAGRSKTGQRVIGIVVMGIAAIMLAPIAIVGMTAAAVAQVMDACSYEMPGFIPDKLHPLNDPRIKAVCLAQKAVGGSDSPPHAVVGGWTNPVGMQPWATRSNHSGGAMDVWVGVGTPVYAPAAGIIHNLSDSCGGLVIGVQHDANYTTAFAHMSSMAVRPGQQVTAGELIGYSGESGSCVNGAHLHFEVRVGPNPNMWGNFIPAYRFMRENGIEMGPCQAGCGIYPM